MENKNMPQDNYFEQELSNAHEGEKFFMEKFFEDYLKFFNDYKDILPKVELTSDDFFENVQIARENFNIISTALDKAIEATRKAKPQFENIKFKDSEEFQQEVKNYIMQHPPAPIKPEVLEDIEVFRKNIVPENHIKPVNRLAKEITKDKIWESETELTVSPKNSKKEVITKVIFDYDNNYVKLSGREKYRPYDQEVYDGIVTLYVANESLFKTEGILFTPAMVYRAMNGLTETESVSEQAIKLVAKSLDKSRFIRVTIDYTEEAKMYNKNYEEAKYEGYLLNAEKITAKIKGKEHKEVYKLMRKPILYDYAQVSGQVITVPMKLLNTRPKFNNTEDVIIIRGYLLKQIEWIKKREKVRVKRSENITYEAIYKELEISKINYNDAMYKKKTHTTRTQVKAILDEWKIQEYIKDYTEYKEGQSIRGITITIDNDLN